MFRHIVLYKLKDRSDESKRALQEKFLSMQGNVPQIRMMEVGTDGLFRLDEPIVSKFWVELDDAGKLIDAHFTAPENLENMSSNKS